MRNDLNWRGFIECLDLELGEDGGEKYSLDDLTLHDVSVKPKVGPTLGENLFLFADADEIQKVLKIAKTRPEIMQAVREGNPDEIPVRERPIVTTKSKRTDKATGPCQCRACKAKKDEEDK
jgi:hypothetical protein